MPLVSPKYLRNQTIIRLFGIDQDKKIKITTLSALRTSGIVVDDDVRPIRGTVNDEKLYASILRAKARIFELAFCNPWDYFFTGTLDKRKYDRSDLPKFHESFTQFIRDQRKKYNCKLEFLLIPELHSDGRAWHIHGFLYDLSPSALHQFTRSDKCSKVLKEKIKAGESIFEWVDYRKKFGFCDLELIRNHEAVSKYVTKYINKNLFSSVKDLNAHLYYHSRGLKFSDKVAVGDLGMHIDYDFWNEFCAVKWSDYSAEYLNDLLYDLWVIDRKKVTVK